MYKIEKNIPIAKLKKKTPIYPFAQMDVGDSFFAKADKKKKAAISVAIHFYQKTHEGVKFCTRSNDEGVRIWRKQ
jgi:hypothetical protein